MGNWVAADKVTEKSIRRLPAVMCFLFLKLYLFCATLPPIIVDDDDVQCKCHDSER